jgi:hypothetical protein
VSYKIRSSQQSYVLTRWLFLRLLGLIYFIAFGSLWLQIEGLIGSNGILPAADFLAAVTERIGPERYHLLPTIFWFGASDAALNWACGGGAVLSLLLAAGILPGPILFLLWLLYLSLVGVGREFLAFQWDNLLLEAGFLAIFFAPWRGCWRSWFDPRRQSSPSFVLLGLFWWLLFRLMFSSGLVKLLSGDPTWSNLTALNFHYETQPLPTWSSWYAHQLPAWFQKMSVVLMFIIELLAPFLIFTPRRWRFGGCAVLILLQLLIMATGNFAFFNWLALALCLLLLDDAGLRRLLPGRATAWLDKGGHAAPLLKISPDYETEALTSRAASSGATRLSKLFHQAQRWLTVAFAIIIIGITGLQMVRLAGFPLPRSVQQLLSWLAPFRTFNSYGLFAVMTTARPEIIIEGSDDGETWQAYEFRWKPGDVMRRPRFVAPHQPRLDWQMWFAALGDYRRNQWLINFMVRLLEGSPEVLALLEKTPFPDRPPRFIRAVVYDYRFTDWAATESSGAWWRREQRGLYAPVLSLPGE